MTEPFPRVTGVILKNNRKVRSLDWSVVRSWDNKELSLKVDEPSVQPHARADSELWLSRQILDKQIVDMDGRRVVRVNDLQLSQVDGSMLLVGVDIGGCRVGPRGGVGGGGRGRGLRVGGGRAPERVSRGGGGPGEGHGSPAALRNVPPNLAPLQP